MTAIDRAALIEAAAETISIHQGSFLILPDMQPTRPLPSQVRLAEAVIPVIARELLAPLRELHFAKTYTCTHLRPPGELGPCCRHSICADCNQMHPCLTVRLLDQIEADVKGGVTDLVAAIRAAARTQEEA